MSKKQVSYATVVQRMISIQAAVHCVSTHLFDRHINEKNQLVSTWTLHTIYPDPDCELTFRALIKLPRRSLSDMWLLNDFVCSITEHPTEFPNHRTTIVNTPYVRYELNNI